MAILDVYINFRGRELRGNFISHLVAALDDGGFKYYIDRDEVQCLPLEVVFTRIEESKIALAIFSKHYGESDWCLNELWKIMREVEEERLTVIPIFFNVTPNDVACQMGEFGTNLTQGGRYYLPDMIQWKKDLTSVTNIMGMSLPNYRDELDFAVNIIAEVKRVLATVTSVSRTSGDSSSEHLRTTLPPYEQRLNQFEERLDFDSDITQTVAIVGMAESRGDDVLNLSKYEDHKTFGIKQRLEELEDKLDLNKITSQLLFFGLLLLFFCLQQIAYMSTPLIGEGSAIDRIAENLPKVLEYIPADKVTQVPIGKYGAKPERSSSDAKTNADFLDSTCTNSPMDSKVKPPNIQVFINFRGDQLRKYFISYLADALRKSGINIFIDTKANIGDELNNLFKKIEDSGIAIVVFSSRYTESEWCLNELVKIKERVQQGLLKVLPIFYKVTPGNVKRLKGEFGDNFRDKEYMFACDESKIKRWKEAIVFVSHMFALTFDDKSMESEFVRIIVKEVKKMLQLQGSYAAVPFP